MTPKILYIERLKKLVILLDHTPYVVTPQFNVREFNPKKLKTLNLHIYFVVVCNPDKIGVLSQSSFQKDKRKIVDWEAKMTIFNYFNSMKI